MRALSQTSVISLHISFTAPVNLHLFSYEVEEKRTCLASAGRGWTNAWKESGKWQGAWPEPWTCLLHKQHRAPSEGSGRIWQKLKARTAQTFKRKKRWRKETRAHRRADRPGGLLFSYQSSVEQNWQGQEQISCFPYFHLPLHHAEDPHTPHFTGTGKKKHSLTGRQRGRRQEKGGLKARVSISERAIKTSSKCTCCSLFETSTVDSDGLCEQFVC